MTESHLSNQIYFNLCNQAFHSMAWLCHSRMQCYNTHGCISTVSLISLKSWNNPVTRSKGETVSFKRRLATGVITLLAACAPVLAAPQSAAASTLVNMNLVCQQNMHSTSWGAKLVANNVYGWRCWNRAYPEQYWLGPFYGADVNYYCSAVEGTSSYYTNYNDPYSWYCY